MKVYILVKGILATGERMRVDGSQDTPFTEEVMVQASEVYKEAESK